MNIFHLIGARTTLASCLAFSVASSVAPRCPGAEDSSAGPKPTATAEPSVRWSDIKDCTYELRVRFFAGLKRLEAGVDTQIRELKAKRATMDGKNDTREWDFAMQQMESARSYLRSVSAELAQTTPATWDQDKDKAGRAWVSTQDAYGRVKSSTTN